LVREQWGRTAGIFDLDHFLPTALYPETQSSYDNLLYCCTRCNAAKASFAVPDPCQVFVQGAVEVHPDGILEARTADARRLMRRLRLDDRQSTQFRMMWIRITAMAQIHEPDVYQQLMGYPDELPNLGRLRPPGGNTRPEGIAASAFARRRQGQLAEVY
jgi:hypothetical protein